MEMGKRRFVQSWTENETFKDWLAQTDDGGAFCALCLCNIQPKKSALTDHTKTKKHIAKTEELRDGTLETTVATINCVDANGCLTVQDSTLTKQIKSSPKKLQQDPTCPPLTISRVVGRASVKSTKNVVVKRVTETGTETGNGEIQDRFDVFGKFVGQSLKQVSEAAADNAILQIQNILYNVKYNGGNEQQHGNVYIVENV